MRKDYKIKISRKDLVILITIIVVGIVIVAALALFFISEAEKLKDA